MKFKKLGRILCAAAIAGVAVTIPFMSGCNSKHPKAEITIEFDGETYVLKYKMYRNMYPQTVQHFIELADNGFYTNMIVHDYQTSYWYTGGYSYLENDEVSYEEASEDGNELLLDYMEAACKEKEYAELADPDNGKITPSVYKNYMSSTGYTDPLNTLIGEFTNNQHKIDNGALKQSYGCLRMYYSAKSGDKVDNVKVYLKKEGSAAGVHGDYEYNSATSIFSIQVGSSTSSSSNYCVFAELQNSDVLEDLESAISDAGMTSSSYNKVTTYIDNYDEYLGSNGNTDEFYVPEQAIIIRSVKITKY